MKKSLLVLILCFSTFSLMSQNSSQAQLLQAQQILSQRGEIVFSFQVPGIEVINNDLTNLISIDYVRALPGGGFEVRAYANPQEFQLFLSRNIPFTILPKTAGKALTMATTVAQMASWDRYPTYSVYEQMMAGFASSYPTLCNIDTIMSPTPSGNYRILVARISDNVNTAENEPQFLYSSSIHGDETTGYYLMLRMINYLLTNYGVLSKVTNLVNNAELWICPLANPEGTYYNSSPAGSTIANSRRANLAGVDMNRNYADPRAGQNPDGNSWQPETQAFMAFAQSHHFNMGANFHGGAEVMNYPWDTWTTSGNQNADRLWWERVCTAYVDSARLVNASYMSDVTSDGVTEGGDWYVITGGRQDYMNFFHHCREVTIELDGTKTTPTENLQGQWNQNYRSLINLMQESLYGIRGIITDSCSGQALRARVWANSYDQTNDSSQVYSALPVGNYHKYMIAGTYSLTFSAPGYNSKTINNISLSNGAATVVNVSLAPTLPDAQFTGLVTNQCTGTVQFTNHSTGASSFMWYFGDGTTSTQQNPSHSYSTSGTYTVKLKAYNCKGSDSIIRGNYITVSVTQAPATTGGSRCGTGQVSLSASGTGTISWYDVSVGGSALGNGSAFTTPSISSTTTYYAEQAIVPPSEYAGKPDTAGGAANYNSTTYYLIFNCLSPVILKSVKVYASTSGTRTIEVRNSSGAALNPPLSISVPVSAGESRINLNFSLPVANGLQLRCTSSNPNMLRNSAGISFPYNLSGKISITGTNASSTRYYFFYDWEIESPACTSSRVPVTATILTLPAAGFTYSINGANVGFTNTTSGGTSWLWSFGDGGTSTLQNPSHTYTANGNYTVRLIAVNGSCSDTITQQVNIVTVGLGDDISIPAYSIYPNPAGAVLYIVPATNPDGNPQPQVMSITGSIIGGIAVNRSKHMLTLDISVLKDGIYILALRDGESITYHRFVKTGR